MYRNRFENTSASPLPQTKRFRSSIYSCRVHNVNIGTLYSEFQVAMRFVLDSKRSRGGKLLAGFVPQVMTV